MTTYYIYSLQPYNCYFPPIAIWIGENGIPSQASIVNTPVMIEVPENKQLVPATKLAVKQIVIGDSLRKPHVHLPRLVQKMMKENEVLIYYIWKGKSITPKLKKTGGALIRSWCLINFNTWSTAGENAGKLRPKSAIMAPSNPGAKESVDRRIHTEYKAVLIRRYRTVWFYPGTICSLSRSSHWWKAYCLHAVIPLHP